MTVSVALPVGSSAAAGRVGAACTLAARGHQVVLFDKNEWLGGKAASVKRGGFPVRHGADHPDRAARAGAHVRQEAGARCRIFSICGGSIRNGAASSTTARCWTCARIWRMAERLAASRREFRAGYRDFSADRPSCTRCRRNSSSGARSRVFGHARASRNMDIATLKDVMALRMGTTVAAQIRKRVPRRAGGADAGPFRAVCRQFAVSVAGGAVQHCAYADHRGRVVSDGRDARGARCPGEAGGRSGRGFAPTGVRRILMRAARGGRGTATGESCRLSAVVSNMDSVRTYRELVGGAPAQVRAAVEAGAGVFGRGAVSRPRPCVRASGAP